MRLPTEWFRNDRLRESFRLQNGGRLTRQGQVCGLWNQGCRRCQERVEEGFVEACCGDLDGTFVIWPYRKELLKRELPVGHRKQCERYNNVKDGGRV